MVCCSSLEQQVRDQTRQNAVLLSQLQAAHTGRPSQLPPATTTPASNSQAVIDANLVDINSIEVIATLMYSIWLYLSTSLAAIFYPTLYLQAPS